MFKKMNRTMDNKGAALVLVIVSLLFVGIIAAAVLSLTMGNVDSTSTTGKGNANFYDTEQFVDDLKIYLQKYANDAATKAYAKQLNTISVTGTVNEGQFKTDFMNELDQIFNTADGSGKKFMDKLTVADITQGVAFDGVLEFSGGTYNPTTHKIEGIVINFKDNSSGDGYATTIYTDMEFSAVMPDLSIRASNGSFDYDIDKYVLIGNKNITFNSVYGTFKGNIFSGKHFTLNVTNGNSLETYSDYIVVGGAILANVSGDPDADTYSYLGASSIGSIEFNGATSDYRNVNEGVTTYTYSDSDDSVSDIWAQNVVVNGTVDVNGIHMYLEDDLSINGAGTNYTADGGTLYAYSTAETISDESATMHKNSGAVIINGKGSTVDLSGLDKMVLAGTAFTEVPEVALGLSGTKSYFVQGESLTYKSLQTAYLVDGDLLWYDSTGNSRVGRNPMTATEYNTWDTNGRRSGTKPANVTGFRVKQVRYNSSSDVNVYYYVYWDFPTATDAINYGVTKRSELEAKITALNGGSILLPDTIVSKGTVIGYDPSVAYNPPTTNPFSATSGTGLASEATNIANCIMDYARLKTGLSKSASLGTESLLARIFNNSAALKEIGVGRTADETSKLTTPSAKRVINGTPADITGSYYLITGNDIILGASENKVETYTEYLKDASGNNVIDPETGNPITVNKSRVKVSINNGDRYVVITDGNVTFASSVNFNGIIIADGNISSNGYNQNLTCFGNVKVGTTYASEFDALINALTNSSAADKALKTILGISGNAGTGGGDSSKDLVAVDTTNTKKN